MSEVNSETTQDDEAIDPFILKRGKDWSDLLENKVLLKDKLLQTIDPTISNQYLVSEVDSNLPKEKLSQVTALWFNAAVLGIHIRFPKSETQLQCYYLYHSTPWFFFITFISVLELISPFIEKPGCDFRGDINAPGDLSLFASPLTTTVFLLIFVCFQLVDTLIYYYSSNLKEFRNFDRTRLQADHTHAWVTSCGICAIICIIDFIFYLGLNGNSPRLSRTLFPLMLISRQENARLIIQGFFRVFRQTLFIIGSLLTVINFMALVGLFLFHNMSQSLGVKDFTLFRHAVMTCLHCFASRPTVLFTVNPYVVESNAPPYFFIFLTLFADILTGTLIVAIANRYYRDFKTLSFRKRLLYRRNALLAILALLNTQDHHSFHQKKSIDSEGSLEDERHMLFDADPGTIGGLSLEQWLLFCSYIDSSLSQPREFAFKIFACCVTSVQDVKRDILRGVLTQPDERLLQRRCTSMEFFCMCAWLASKVKFRSVATVHKRQSILSAMKERTAHIIDEDGNENIRIGDAVGDQALSTVESGGVVPSMRVKRVKSSVELVAISSNGPTSAENDQIMHSQNPMYADKSGGDVPSAMHTAPVRSRRFTGHYDDNVSLKPRGLLNDIYHRLVVDTGILERVIAFSVTVCYPRFHIYSFSMKYVTLFNALMHILLVVQLSFVSAASPSPAWLLAGWPLLITFFFDNFVKYFASAHSKATSLKDLAINIAALIAKSFLGVSGHIYGAAYVAVVLIQSLRSLKLFALIPGAASVSSIVPTVLRVFELLFLVIFMFTIIAHEFFCGTLDANNVTGADDDSGGWAKFSTLLNFSSYLQTFYTLIQISLLSNWSIVMDAVAKGGTPIAAYGFFFVYRLTMVLTVLPLLTSFIIQAFIAQLSLKRIEKTMKEAYMVVSNKVLSTGMMRLWSTNSSETVSGAPNPFRAIVTKMNRELTHECKLARAKLHSVIEDFTEFSKSNLIHPNHAARLQPTGFVLPLFQLDNVSILYAKQHWEALADSVNESRPENTDLAEDDGGDESHSASIATLNIPEDYHPILANLWYHDALDGRRLELPTSVNELIAYSLVRSSGMRFLITSTAIIQILITMILPSFCSNSYISSPAAKVSLAHKQILEIGIFNLVAGLLYLFDTVLEFWIKVSTKKVRSLLFTWTSFRFVCSFIIILSQMAYLGGQTHGRYALALYPFFIITRQVDLRQMLHGLAVSIYGSRIVYNLLFTILLVWTFLGYFLFHRFLTNARRFATIYRSFQTCLHCFTSGPFSLLVVKPYFKIGQVSAAFFVLLTLTTEVIGNAMIIAVGNVEYKAFVDKNIARRIDCRKHCVVAMWKLFSYNHAMNRHSWLRLCTGFNGKYALSSAHANVLFTYVAGHQVGAKCSMKQFFGLIGMISACARAEEVEFIDSGIRIKSTTESGQSARLLLANSNRNVYSSSHRDARIPRTLSQISQKRKSLVPRGNLRQIINTKAVGISNAAEDNFDECLSFIENVRHFSRGYGPQIQQYILFVEPRIPSYITPIALRYFPQLAEEIYVGCTMLVNYKIHVGPEIGVFECFTVIMHLFLLLQLNFISFNDTVSVAWLRFGYFLEFYFWLEMLIRMIAIGGLEFLTIVQNRNHFLINLVSLVCMIAQGSSLNTNSIAMVILIIVQSLRFVRVLADFLGIATEMLVEIRATISNVFLIQWCVIYFFAVIAQMQFCGALNPNDIDTSSTDDDAANWPKFANLLNFTTMYYSLFTMFEISVLGNWAMVPDAIVKSSDSVHKTAVFFFFYSYRLLMTLVIYPLLMSFIIRSFIALRDSISIEKELHAEQLKQRVLLNPDKRASQRMIQNSVDNTPGVLKTLSQVFEQSLKVEEEKVLETTSDSVFARFLSYLSARIKRMKLFVTTDTATAVAKNIGNSFEDLWSFNEKRVIENNELYSNMVLLHANSQEETRFLSEVLSSIRSEVDTSSSHQD